ncbi:MAG: LamG-like jellyroll fold domain-containing protein, partial [Candidatus Poribacteria bacterium]
MTRIVLLMMLFILVPAIIASAAVKPENIIGLWFFDEGKGDTAADSSGNKHDGAITSAKWTDGKYGKALSFEGAGGVKITSTEKLSLGDQFTMMAFFNAKTLNNYHAIICKNNEYLLRMDNLAEGGKMSAFVNLDGGWEPRASAFVPVKDTWYHYAAVYSSKTKTLIVYVNGVNSGQSVRA